MGKYIKKFNTHSDYEDFIETEDFILPNVSYCVDNKDVHYNPIFWTYEYEPGRFIAGEILNDTLYMYAPVGSGKKWVMNETGKVLGSAYMSRDGHDIQSDIIEDINARFGTDFYQEDDVDKDFTTGETLPDWDRYKKIKTDHAYVDLDLPSGTLWATMNVGANSETDAGFYFLWGDTQGYADASTKEFSWDDYEFNPSGDGETFTKYNSTDNKIVLDIGDDAARTNWSSSWKMPTEEQCEELLNTEYVTNTWVTNYHGSGVNGYLFTSVSNGNTMFIPAAGYANNGTINNIGDEGSIWSNSLQSEYVNSARFLNFDDQEAYLDGINRCTGFPVRPVAN